MPFRRARVRHKTPAERLAFAARIAAAQIDCPAARRNAARDADQIPKTLAEKFNSGGKGDVAFHVRALMRDLPHIKADERPGYALLLRQCIDALESPSFVIVSSEVLGEKRKVFA